MRAIRSYRRPKSRGVPPWKESLDGIVLRYGMFYGPGTGFEVAPGKPAVHVDAAAKAAMLAIESGAPGVYNIAEDGGGVSTVRAHRELGWASD